MNVLKAIFRFLVDTINEFGADNAATLAAALAFYSALALAPLLVIFMFFAGLIGPEAQAQLLSQIQNLVGPEANSGISLVLDSLRQQHHSGVISAIFGSIALLVSATGVFAQLQFSINTIWDVHAKPGNDIWNFIRQRLLSLLLMGAIGLLTLISLVLSAALSFIFSGHNHIWSSLDFLGSLAVYVLVFAVIFKVLPDVELAWRDVWTGALITALLFVIGKFAIGKYLGYSGVGSAYGAAGSLVVLLLWVYYTAVVVFLGAEMAQVQARRHDRGLKPKKYGELDWEIREQLRSKIPNETAD
jgi:membrane protein